MQEFVKFFKKHSNKEEDEQESIPKQLPKVNNKNSFKTNFTNFNFKPNFTFAQPKMHPCFLNNCNLWLLKPHELNRGRGISLFNKLTTFKNFLNIYQGIDPTPRIKSEGDRSPSTRNNFPKTNKFVIQKYIEKPFLINNRKFDIRIWTLVDHELNLYVFKEWYIRLSSEYYSLSDNNIENLFVHLTNNAVQKNSAKYGKLEKGNIISNHEFKVKEN